MSEQTATTTHTPKKVNSILITQARPETEKSPYFDLAKKYAVKVDFHPFIKVEGITVREFRKQKIEIADFTSIVFTSRNAIDHFFRLCDEMRFKISQDFKYYCITEAVALYLQKFINYRKRKVFYSPDGSTQGLMDIIAKHKVNERYISPMSDSSKSEITQFMQRSNIQFAEATFHKTVSNDISLPMQQGYDLIVFFSPYSIQALYDYDAGFTQNGTLLGTFGPTTTKAAEDRGLQLHIKAPMPNAPSMVAAIELYLLGK
ncbi:MAG: uroporphyrinogen-III synthase [Chitinophagia bacterium]|nr:uroporphyrinogen-III synthase [Chitinophagia bacterium]